MFAYCGNNPANMSDNNGEVAFFVVTGVVGALIGAGIGYAKSGTLKGALTGAAIGGAVGLAGGALAASCFTGSATASATSAFSAIKEGIGIVSKTVHPTWQAAEKSLRTTTGSVTSSASRTFSTPYGNRIVDAFNPKLRKIAEAKYGYQGLSTSIKNQIKKDLWLLQNDSRVKSVEWHFYHSAASNSQGLSQNLRNELTSVGFKIVEHYRK